MKNRLFIYLARRDKKGIKTIANFPYSEICFPTKINIKNLEKLNLSDEIKNQIYIELQKNKLIYEIYVEAAESFVKLKESLIRRGFSNLPLQEINVLKNIRFDINKEMLISKKSTILRKKYN